MRILQHFRRHRRRPSLHVESTDADESVVPLGPGLTIDTAHPSMSPPRLTLGTPPPDVELLRKFQSSLAPLRSPMFYNPLVGMYLTHFDGLVSASFNRDLARAMARAVNAVAHRPSDPATGLDLEDAIMRHCACWDYLFQMLIHFLMLHEDVLPERRDKDRLASVVMFNVDFVEENGIMHLRRTPRSREAALRAFRSARESVDYSRKGVRGEHFFKRVGRKYAPAPWLTEVKGLLRSTYVREIHDLRNQIAHAHPLTSQMFPEFSSGGISGAVLSYRADAPVDLVSVGKALERAHHALEKAIRISRTAIISQDIPNMKDNEGVEYVALTLDCADCGVRSYLPRANSAPDSRLCRACGNDDAGSLDIVTSAQVPEQVWHDLLTQTIADLQKLKVD